MSATFKEILEENLSELNGGVSWLDRLRFLTLGPINRASDSE